MRRIEDDAQSYPDGTQAPGGVLRTRDLLGAGWSTGDIERSVRRGAITRLRQGWYACPGADDRVVRAVRAGGALGCASALAFHGAWDVTLGTVHVRTDHNRSTRLPTGLRHCHSVGDRDDLAPARSVDDLEVALRSAWRCLGREDFVVVCDSLLHTGLMSGAQVRHAIGPRRDVGAVLGRCDRAESGTESLVRLRLRHRGVRLQTQVLIPGVGRVDLLVGERLVIEVDSVAHHTGHEHFHTDRRRDLALRALGYIVVRLTYQQVVHDWSATEQSLLTMIRRGDHRWAAGRARRHA